MSLSYEDEQYAYHLTYTTVRLYGNHDQAHRWACYARDSWEIANAIKKGYSKGREFLRVARFNCHEEDVYKVLVREGIEPPPKPAIQRYDHHCPGCPHTAPHGHGQIPPVPPHAPYSPPVPHSPPHGPQVPNMGEDDDEDDEDIRKKLEDQ